MLETVTWSFTSSEYGKLFRKENDPILLANPISSDLDEMRPSLYVNLLLACAKNTKKGYPNQAMFEVGPMFYGKEVGEQKHVATGIRAGENYKKHWLGENRKVDVFDAKKDAITALGACNAPVANLQVSNQAPFYYHPGRSGCLRLGKNILGYFGEIHPKILKSFGIKETVVGFEIYPYDVPQPKKKGTKTIKMLEASQLQPLDRDFAFIVDDKINANDLIMAVRGADKNLIQNVGVFDVYEGNNLEKGKKSIALQVTLQPFEKTLKEKDLENISNKIINSVKKRTGGELRA
jgi:phenylalanyl-tRNA synthetase beta chain